MGLFPENNPSPPPPKEARLNQFSYGTRLATMGSSCELLLAEDGVHLRKSKVSHLPHRHPYQPVKPAQLVQQLDCTDVSFPRYTSRHCIPKIIGHIWWVYFLKIIPRHLQTKGGQAGSVLL